MVINSGGCEVDIGEPEDFRADFIRFRGNRTLTAQARGFQSLQHFNVFCHQHPEYAAACDQEIAKAAAADFWAKKAEGKLEAALDQGERWAIERALLDQCASRGWGSHDRSLKAASAPSSSETRSASGRNLTEALRAPIRPPKAEAEAPAEETTADA